MAHLKPFAALRPNAELASRICELPYDVMSSSEARQMAFGNLLSFLHVSKPEIDLPTGTDIYSPLIYEKGRENFERLIQTGALTRDAQPRYYYYRQTMGRHQQTGLVAAASCEEYLRGIIKKHELTRPDKEDDRVRHIESLNSQTGPVFLTYQATPALDQLAAALTAGPPEVDFTAADGVRHSAWVVTEQSHVDQITAGFRQVPYLYIADGHHRSAAAARVFQKRNGQGESAFFLSVIFPHNQLQILPYNRVLKDLNGFTPDSLLLKLEMIFEIEKTENPAPSKKHQLAFYINHSWYALLFKPSFISGSKDMEQLDVSLLQRHILDPLFGITDPRTSQRINFIGGIRGTRELERVVNSGDYACAFSMFPTSVEDLMSIVDAGGIMPPKSTWFEPKLRDAMFCHMIA